MSTTLPPTLAPLAAIDMGSNSFRLEIGQLQQGRYRRIDYLKETVRLGAGLDADARLGGDAVARGLRCLGHFARRLQGFTAAQVRAVATQTLREARNRDEFLAQAQQALGFPIEVISGREEARLIYAGVAHLQPSTQRRLVVDIGGRSTEMIIGEGRLPMAAESFGIGCVSLSMRFFAEGRLTRAAFEAARVAAEAEFEEALELFAPSQWSEALGSSGTAGAVAQMIAAAGVGDGGITPAGLQWCIDRCVEAGRIEALKLPGLKPDRAAVIPGGLAILSALSGQFGITTMSAAKGALRQGVIVDLDERLAALRRERPGDLRDTTVGEMQRRFAVDTAQAARVRSVAVALYDQVQPQAEAAERRELGWAADLHEIGLMVSHHDHHRHSAYLVANVDAAGFSQSQQRRVADLVLGQRGGLRKLEAALARPDFAWQVLCLRLAVIACHARSAGEPAALALQPRGSGALLALPPDWGDAHPRSAFLLREEAAAWKRVGALSFELRG